MARDIEYVANLNLQGNEIKNVVVEAVTTKPTTDSLGKKGRIVSHEGDLYISDGANFALLGKSGDVDKLWTVVGKTTNDGLQKMVADNTTSIGENATKISKNISEILQNKNDITALAGRMNTAESDIDDLETAVGTEGTGLTGRVATIESDLNTATTGLKAVVATHTTQIAGKVDKVSGKQLSTEDYTTDEKNKLAGITAGAQVNVIESVYLDGVAQTIDSGTKKVTLDLSAYAKADSVASALIYKGTKATYEELPPTGNKAGDVWNVTAAHGDTPAGTNYAWSGSEWDPLAGTVSFANYYTKTETQDYVTGLNYVNKTAADETYVPKTTKVNGHALSADVTVTAADVGLGNVDNTSDEDKPISTATQTALNKKVDANVAITGGTACKITYDAKGLVTAGAALEVGDLPIDIPSTQIKDFKTEVRKANRFEFVETVNDVSVQITHGLGVQYPHVSVYNTSTGCIVYADIHYDSENAITVSGTANLGAIAVIISA